MKASELDGTLPIFSGVPISWALAVPLAAMAVAVARAIAPVTNLRRIMRTPCAMKTCDGIYIQSPAVGGASELHRSSSALIGNIITCAAFRGVYGENAGGAWSRQRMMS